MTPDARWLAVLAAALAPVAAAQLPSGGSTDCATILGEPSSLHIFQMTPNCVINWESFDIGDGFAVFFDQESSWRLLNRVTGEQFSTIAGLLRADGTVYIVNPAGIFFTGTAVVDVGGIYAAAGAISDEDFMAGVDRFTGLAGEVINEGQLFGQAVHLIGQRIVNDGAITAAGGVVTLLAGENEVLIGEQDGHILVRIDGVDLTGDLSVSPGNVSPVLTGDAAVENMGTIDASGGRAILGAGDLVSLAIRNTGLIDTSGGSVQMAALGGTVVHGGEITTGELAMTGDVLFLDADVHADDARFNDPVVIGSDVLVSGAQDAEADSVLFASTVDGHVGELNRLDVDSTQTTFAGGVGGLAPLLGLDVSGDAAVGGNVSALDGVSFGGDVVMTGGGNQTIDAGVGTLHAGGSVTKSVGGSLTLRSAEALDLEGDVTVDTASGDLVLTAPSIEAGGDLTSASGDVSVNGPAVIAGSVTAGLDARFTTDVEVGGDVKAGDDAFFFGDASVGGDVTVGDEAQFFGSAQVGGDVTAGDDATFFDEAEVGGSVSAVDTVQFFAVAIVVGDVTAGNDALFLAGAEVGGDVAVGDDLTFFGDALVGGDVTAGDDALFLGRAQIGGSVDVVDDVDFFGEAIVGLDVVAGDDVTFFDDAVVGRHVFAGDDAAFGGTAEVGGTVDVDGDAEFSGRAEIGGSVIAGDDARFFADAVVEGSVTAVDNAEFSGRAEIGGSVSAGGDASFFAEAQIGGGVTAGDDAEFFGTAVVGGDVIAGDDVEFEAHATLGGDVIAADAVRINSTATFNGTGDRQDQLIEAGGTLRLKDAIAKTTSGSLTLVSSEPMVLNGSSIEALDDILINPQGRSDVPTTATIEANDDLAIVSHRGDVLFGPNEKLTVLGDLLISAVRATLGDLSTLGDMIVMAQEIFLLARAPGEVLTFDGRLLSDTGVDFVAGGRFFFSVAPTMDGPGAAPLFASANADADALATLGAFRLRVISPFFAGMFKRGGTFLDLRADGPTLSQLAEALADDPRGPDVGNVTEPLPLSESELARLVALGIRVRPVGAAESGGGGGHLYYDAPREAADPVRTVSIGRLHPDAIRDLLDRHDALRGPVREDLAAAWEEYAASSGAPNGSGFRAYLESSTDRADALAYLDRLRAVLDQLALSGLSPSEFGRAARAILDPYTPPAMERGQLREALGD